jgi:hypothetical protein
MAFREVYRRHKLLFRFDPDLDLIEVRFRGRLETVRLADYRPLHQRRAGVDFGRIDGIDEDAQMCYAERYETA